MTTAVDYAAGTPVIAAARALAVVLPQFHPVPENDGWWGRGFTEWTNVAKAKPLFPGHYQPHLPGELGFYDLRLPESRQAQADLAREHGVAGFCYYHYWFNGRRILERPVNEILASGKPDFPFCLCWANENWTRAWDGRDREVLLQQVYSPEDDEQHIDHLMPFFADRRYIRIQGRPLFIVYKAAALPDPRATFERWRRQARAAGIGELFLAQFEALGNGSALDPREIGLDLSIEFAPDWRSLGGQYYRTWKGRLATALGLVPRAYAEHSIHDYSRMVAQATHKPMPQYPFTRCISPGFDSSPRRPARNAVILRNSTPERFGAWARWAVEELGRHDPTGEKLLFVNAWNEWAEGNHLEPDARHGRAYLEALRQALQPR
jgi:lipopolysaccharide biosynthesis protein